MASVQHETGKRGAWHNPDCDRHKLRPMVELYIALDGLDLSFLPDEVTQFIDLWEEGLSMYDIAAKMNRHAEELAVLLIDLSMRKKVIARNGGLLGESV